MELAMITFKQVMLMFILIMAGYFCVRLGAVKKEAKEHFSDLLMKLVIPCMILDSYFSEFDPAVAGNIFVAFALAAVMILLGAVISFPLTRKLAESDRPMLWFACIFSNAGYMGFPLIQALFGEEGMIYASAFLSVFNILVWTFGVVIAGGKVAPREVVKKDLTTPAIIAVAFGLVMYFARIPVPEMIKAPITLFGDMNTPLAMFITGMIMASANLVDFIKNKTIWWILLVRLLLIPIVMLALIAIIDLDGMPASVCLILEAAPTAAISAGFAVEYRYNAELIAGCVVVSTIMSIITLPLVAYAITIIM